MVVYFIAQNADWFMNYPPFLAAHSGTYGWDNQEGVSLITYLETLLDPSTFADEIVLTAMSFMWGVTRSQITVSKETQEEITCLNFALDPVYMYFGSLSVFLPVVTGVFESSLSYVLGCQ